MKTFRDILEIDVANWPDFVNPKKKKKKGKGKLKSDLKKQPEGK
jgi:hypothetical protein